MSTLRAQLQGDLAQALKAADMVTLQTLRMVEAALQNEQLAQRDALSDAAVLRVLVKEVHQRREAADLYRAGGRDDRAVAEGAEAAVIERYLPVQMTDVELESLVRETLDTLAKSIQGAPSASVIGRVTGAVMGSVQGRADGSRVRAAVQRLLATASVPPSS